MCYNSFVHFDGNGVDIAGFIESLIMIVPSSCVIHELRFPVFCIIVMDAIFEQIEIIINLIYIFFGNSMILQESPEKITWVKC